MVADDGSAGHDAALHAASADAPDAPYDDVPATHVVGCTRHRRLLKLMLKAYA